MYRTVCEQHTVCTTLSSQLYNCVSRLQEEAEAERASIYRSVIINTSKEMMCFSDFPIPDHFPNYMHNSRILEYFRMYAQHFDLTRHVRFQVSVRFPCPAALCENDCTV